MNSTPRTPTFAFFASRMILRDTGDERDSETGLDHTLFRQYSSNTGNWLTPDPAGLAAVDPSNPQSWNRYVYALNDSMNLIDPSGLCPGGLRPPCKAKASTGGGAGGIFGGGGGIIIIISPGGSVETIQGGLGDGGSSIDGSFFGPDVSILDFGPGGDLGGGDGIFGGLFSNVKKAIRTLVCTATANLVTAAQVNGGAVGIGIGGSAGAGLLVGFAGGLGVQVVADGSGNVGLAFSGSYNPGFGVFGAGALSGAQFTNSTARSIFDLGGSSTSAGVSGALFGVGVGVDVSNSRSSGSVTATVGAGIGGRGAAFTRTHTLVPKILSTDCGPN